ncbi:hypothetical protein BG011_001556 [Mortierella polycephala]|uniref:Rho-GAP domain-containing protein n=1 Tax=Mortierella polycephala TaxID=41804 RepID=A0A9P6Q800_9FUNG|nr:hypothetical protein BG011_001556 [Mortierella polycephala]
MSLRLVSSAKNLRDQFKGNSNNSNNSNTTSNNTSNSHNAMSSGSSIFTAASGISHAKTMDVARMNSANSILSRPGTVLRATSNGNLRRTKSAHKKKLIAKVFADDSGHNDALPDLSMEMTLLIVKRLTTKGILRQVQMGQNQKVIMDTIRLILDDDASTELSVLRQIDIHLVAHAMKWAIRYSEETLVTYGDYQALYLNQDRSFSRFVRDLPPTNRSILLDLFSLCADVTLLAHLNGMTLVAVAKAISLSIMAEPEREFTTFDASLQQRNLWGAACEDLLRAFLRIKTTHDLAKIEQEDEVDENRYVDNITREVRSARQRSNEAGSMPHIPMNSRHDVSVPSSVGSGATVTPSGSIRGRSVNNPLDQASTSRSVSPLSQHSSTLNESLSRNHSLVKSNSTRSGPISPARHHDQELMEYEEIMKNQSHLGRLRQSRQFRQSRQYRQSMSLKSGDKDRRRSSIADMESLYMLPVDDSTDGYESEPEPFHDTILPDFADGLGWDFSKLDALQVEEGPSLNVSQSASVSRSNSSSTHGSTLPSSDASLKQQPHATTVQIESLYQGNGMESRFPPQVMVQRSATSSTMTRAGHTAGAGYTSPTVSPQHAKRDSFLYRSLSLDPQTMNGRNHKRPTELRHDILTRELTLQAEKPEVADDIRQRVMQVKQNGLEDAPASPRSTFSLESSPQDLDRPAIPTRNASHGLGRSMSNMSRSSHTSKSSRMSKSSNSDTKLEINVGGLPPKSSHPGAMDELTPVSNPSSSSSIASPESQHSIRKSQEHGANTEKKFEVISRPKDIEISVHFTPISPVSPKTELRSKFHESFSDLPVAPPPGYVQRQSGASHPHKKSPTTTTTTTTNIKSGQSSKMSTSSSTISSSLQQPSSKSMSRSNSKGQPHPAPLSLQQSVNSSNASIASSATSASESKSKAAGFIRALSFKLRSKHSDEHLKPVKINNQVVGSAPVPPALPIQPPRLELSFLGEVPSGASTSATASKLATGGNMPPATAPATFLHPGTSLTGSPESWRRAAQAALPVPSASTDRLGSDRLKGFTGARRSSGALFGSGNVALREQRRKSRISVVSPRSPGNLHHHSGANSPSARSKADGKRAVGSSDPSSGRSPNRRERTLSDSSYTTDDSGSLDDPTTKGEQPPTATNPKKAGEREYRFSTATLLKDGKLYYQLQWDQFSESGFKSDFFHQPEQYLTGLQQKRISKFPANGPVMNSSAAMGKTKMSLPPTNSVTSQDLAPLGQVGQNQDQGYSPDPGPSPAQRAAAMKAARESFMALAKDPKALAALKAGSTGGIAGAASQDPKMLMSKPGKQSTTVGGAGSFSSSHTPSPATDKNLSAPVCNPAFSPPKSPKKSRLFGARLKSSKKNNRLSTSMASSSSAMNSSLGKKRGLPMGVGKRDTLTKTEESLDEVFPWTCIEHMAGQESGWVMLEPVQDGAVGWIKIDKLEEEMARFAQAEQRQQQQQQQ